MTNDWYSIQDDEFSKWAELSAMLLSSSEFKKLICPSCDLEKIRFFFLRHRIGNRGGLWLWCTACKKYYHSSCIVPEWWNDVSEVPYEKIESDPTIPNNYWSEIVKKNYVLNINKKS